MPINSLSPAFVKVNYASPWGTHVMTIPSVAIGDAPLSAPTFKHFILRGAELPVECSAAVIAYLDLVKVLYGSGVVFSDATVYSQPTPSDVPLPVASFTLGIAGTTAGSPLAEKASQTTVTMRADDFTLFKMVYLDAAIYQWDKLAAPAGYTGLADIVDYVSADASWLASRGGGRPQTFLQTAFTLNEKLRRRYGMN